MRISKILFYTLIFCLPVNWGYHFMSEASYLHGILVDYSIPTLRFTDFLVIAFIFSAFIELNLSFEWIIKKNYFRLFWLFIFFSLFSLPVLSFVSYLIFFVKLLEMGLLFVSVGLVKDDIDFSLAARLFGVSAFLVSILAFSQFVLQRSVFGYYFYGEPLLSLSTSHVAKGMFFEEQKILPYGLFPHPNILGGYISIVMIWILYLFTKAKSLTRVVLSLMGGFFIIILFLTQSLSAVLSLAFGIFLYLYLKRYMKVDVIRWLSPRRKVSSNFALFIAPLSFIMSLAILPVSNVLNGKVSVIRRVELLRAAFEMFKLKPFFGVGLNNFVANLPNFIQTADSFWFMQPVHNLFALIAVEGGVFALTIFLIFYSLMLKNLFIKMKVYMKVIDIVIFTNLIQILVISMFDHYFWTIQQGQILMWILLGLAICALRVQKKDSLKL